MSTIAEKLTTIAENEQRIYDKGADDANIRFWNGFTDNRTRLTYTKAFQHMNFSGVTIPNGLVLSDRYLICPSMFQEYAGTTLPIGIDMSNVNLDRSKNQTPSFRWFQGCELLKYIYDMNLPATGYYNLAFAFCYELETIEMIRSNKASDFSDAFEECYKLKNITFDGIIGNDINFQYSPLTIESMKNIISHLANYSGTENAATYTLTFTDACWEALEASGKPYDDGLTTDETLTWKNYVISLGWNV